MSIELSEVLAPVALNDTERRVVERIVSVLKAELGEDLRAIWLYGSRARGEADPTETDIDRRSDVDMLVVLDAARDAASVSWDILAISGVPPLRRLVGRRGGYVQSIPPGYGRDRRGRMSPRSEEFIEQSAIAPSSLARYSPPAIARVP